MRRINRREFLKQSASAAGAMAAMMCTGGACGTSGKTSSALGKKVIVVGMDGMDPRLCERMMAAGGLPNLKKLAQQNGYRVLGTSDPPQSPVAWANFINGAGPGSHGIFDFIHRDPELQVAPFFSAAETIAGEGYVEFGDHKIQLDFWPFNHVPTRTILKRQGTPFWDYLDRAGIPSTFYDLPSNYPPSPSRYGNHRCLAGMGTPDLLGTYGTFQHFAEKGLIKKVSKGGGTEAPIHFIGDTSRTLRLSGPSDALLKDPQSIEIPFVVHRDRQARAAVIEIQGQTLVLQQGEWSRWVDLKFPVSTPAVMPDKVVSGICRFYLQEVAPNFRLYVSPINANPIDPAIQLTEPAGFSREMAEKLGFFYTTGFQEDHKALSRNIFSEAEYIDQAGYVLQEREALLHFALDNFDDGLLFFYFSSTDLQAHMLWWDSDRPHPTRSSGVAEECFQHLQTVYGRMDEIVGELIKRYGDAAHIIIMSDHGFSNFQRQFNLNTWLRNNGYLGPGRAASIMRDVDWDGSRAYGLGMNGLYLNLQGRERYGIVDPKTEREELLEELVKKLESVRDADGRRVIRKAHRTDRIYSGEAMGYAPDLILGYSRDFRASWKTCLGDLEADETSDNESAWCADHCMDAIEVPGVLFSNRPIVAADPSLVDLAPSILYEFGLTPPGHMEGRKIFKG